MTSVLKECVGLWGKAEVRNGTPPTLLYDDVVYVPYQHDGTWGMFGSSGSPVEGSVDLQGPLGQPQGQKLEWSGLAEIVAPEQSYVYGGLLNPHYGHFLINSLSRLWPLATPDARRHKILFHAGSPAQSWFDLPFVRHIFNALDLTIDSIAIFDSPTRVRQLIVPTVSFQEQHFVYTAYKELCHQIGERVLGQFNPKSGLPPVYLTKTALKGGVGRVLDEGIIEKRLEQAGVEIIRPETISLREQIALFVERPSISGTIGSSFHTSIFVHPRTRIVALSTIPNPNSNFAMIDAVNGQDATYVYAEGTQVVSDAGQDFLTSFALPDPDRIAEELIGIMFNAQPAIVGQSNRTSTYETEAITFTRQNVDHKNDSSQGEGAMSPYSLFLNNTGRPIHKAGHYFFAYERHFGRYVGQPMTFLEIGAGNGGSSQMWKRWLGPLARIVTIDINPVCLQFEDEQVSVRIGDQSDPTFLRAILDEFGVPDVIIDDGSHQMAHVTASFDFLYNRMAANGVYLIEDMHTAYWPSYGGGCGAPTSMVERFKHLIDVMNADHVRDDSVKPDGFTRSTIAMTAYDSILVFERSPFINKHMRIIGDDTKRVNY